MSGCVEANSTLTHQALPRFGELMGANQPSWRRLRGFVAVDFEDGCDAFFFRMTESNEPSEALALGAAEEFKQINRKRKQVILAIRHIAAENGIALQISASGVWQTQWGSATSTLQVGPALTRLAKELAPAELLMRFLEHQWFPKIDSARAAILVAHEKAPEKEAKWRREDEVEPLIGPGILSLDCSTVDDPGFQLESSEEFIAQLAPHRNSPGQLVLNSVVERVGRNRFSFDLLSKGTADLSFSDRLDDYQIIPQGKRLGGLIKTLGVPGSIDKLVQEFQVLDEARSRALALIQTVMAKHGFYLDADGWYFGRTHREFKFPTGRQLTLSLKRIPPHQVILNWLENNRPFEPLPESDQLLRMTDTEKVVPERKALALRPPATESERLPVMKALDVARLDQRANAIISEAKNAVEALSVNDRLYDQHHPLWLWTQPLWYSRGSDKWTDETWWLDLASKHWGHGPDQLAALAMMFSGRHNLRPEMLQRLNDFESWDSEAFDDGLLWFLVDDLPWPIDTYEDYPAFPRVLGSPPPPLARRAAMRCRESLKGARDSAGDQEKRENFAQALEHAAKLDHVSAREWMTDEEIAFLREGCFEWASHDDPTSLRQDSPLAVAAHFGWQDLTQTLETKPAFIAAHFECEAISFEPGMLALRISLIGPCALAARFAAHAMSSDFTPIIEQQVETIVGTVNQNMRDALRTGLLNGRRLDLLAAAIAWKRCRFVGAGLIWGHNR